MKIRWPIIAVLIIALALALAGGATMLWRLFIFLVILLGVSYIWLRLLARNVEGRIDKSPQFCRAGDYFEESFTVVNHSRLPMLLFEAQEDTNLPGYHNDVKFSLPSRGSYTWNTRDLCRRRGQYRISNLKAKIFDPLGIFYVQKELIDSRYINILPATIDLPYFRVLPRREPGLVTRRWFAGEPGHNASRVREYISGDSLRFIHWHTTAHNGQLMVMEFDPDFARTYVFSDIWVILDMQAECNFGSGYETTSEYGVTIASSLVKKYLDDDKKVGFLASGNHSYLFTPDSGVEHEQRISQSLAAIEPAGVVPVSSLIISQEERINKGSAVIVATSAGFTTLGLPLRRLVNRGVAVTAVLLDAASFGGTIAALDTARNLNTDVIQAYIVRRGADMGRALDIRHRSSSAQIPGVRP